MEAKWAFHFWFLGTWRSRMIPSWNVNKSYRKDQSSLVHSERALARSPNVNFGAITNPLTCAWPTVCFLLTTRGMENPSDDCKAKAKCSNCIKLQICASRYIRRAKHASWLYILTEPRTFLVLSETKKPSSAESQMKSHQSVYLLPQALTSGARRRGKTKVSSEMKSLSEPDPTAGFTCDWTLPVDVLW